MVIKTEKAAKKLKVHRITLYCLEKAGKIPRIPRDRNGHRIFTPELMEVLQRKIHPELYLSDSKK